MGLKWGLDTMCYLFQIVSILIIGVEINPQTLRSKNSITNSIGQNYKIISIGTFTKGSPKFELERYQDENQLKISVNKTFHMGVFLVTRGEYELFVQETNHKSDNRWKDPGFFQDNRHPVVNVSWKDANAFANWLNYLTKEREAGRSYRLPTEAEWEFAARGGSNTPFYTGNSLNTDQANFDGNFPYSDGNKGIYRRGTVPVGSFPANPFGLYDMAGNAWQWCADLYDSQTEKENNSEDDLRRVTKGGCWLNSAGRCRSASRLGVYPASRYYTIGFRLVLETK